MDLNYLFHRQQVERSRAEAAESEEARAIHLELARRYELRIDALSNGGKLFGTDDEVEERTVPSQS